MKGPPESYWGEKGSLVRTYPRRGKLQGLRENYRSRLNGLRIRSPAREKGYRVRVLGKVFWKTALREAN